MPTDKIHQRRNLLANQGGQCRYCGDPLSPETATVDHKRARSQGGPNRCRNKVAACRRCNEEKGALDLQTFLRLRHDPEALALARKAMGTRLQRRALAAQRFLAYLNRKMGSLSAEQVAVLVALAWLRSPRRHHPGLADAVPLICRGLLALHVGPNQSQIVDTVVDSRAGFKKDNGNSTR